LWIVWYEYMKMYEWLMDVEYDVYHSLVYFLLYLDCENSYEIVESLWWCCWWLYMYMSIYVAGEFSYMLLATIWWCKHVLKYVGVDFGVDCVICTRIHDWWWQSIYPYWRRLWCVCCIMRWRPRRWFGTTCI